MRSAKDPSVHYLHFFSLRTGASEFFVDAGQTHRDCGKHGVGWQGTRTAHTPTS